MGGIRNKHNGFEGTIYGKEKTWILINVLTTVILNHEGQQFYTISRLFTKSIFTKYRKITHCLEGASIGTKKDYSLNVESLNLDSTA
jgi:hypothetical protein